MDRLDLQEILTPALYKKVLGWQFPWDPPVDMTFAAKFLIMGEPDNVREVYKTTHSQALKPISMIKLEQPEKVPSDLTPYLPEPSSPNYAEHTLALIILLDQAPRQIYRRKDTRWTNMYFDALTQSLVSDLISSDKFPLSSAWWNARYPGFEDAMVRRQFLIVPLVHSESKENHIIAQRMIEKLRIEVESYTRKRDPSRDTMEEDKRDAYLFARIITKAEKDGVPETFAEFMFWLLRLMDAHKPVVDHFGHYPYRNELMGRETTKEEEEFLEKTGNFGAPGLTPEEAKKLRHDIENDEWEPLSDEKPWDQQVGSP